MSRMICSVCNSILDYDDCLQFTQHWNDDLRATEQFAGLRCPECGADGEFLKEVEECKNCRNAFEPGTLIAGELCEDCLKWYVRNQPFYVWEFIEVAELKDEFAEFVAARI